jgi:ferredoxin
VIANYGYEDGSGFYYITINGNTCVTCTEHACVTACPQSVYAVELDDYDDCVAVVVEGARKRLRELCSTCKGKSTASTGAPNVPCVSVCPGDALQHSW